MMDYIISAVTKEVFAKVELVTFDAENYKYTFKALETDWPENLLETVQEYYNILEEGALSLLDEVEEEIYSYKLMIKNLNVRVYSILIKEDTIEFYSHYPSGKGFKEISPFGW